jgi:hypothetical protein
VNESIYLPGYSAKSIHGVGNDKLEGKIEVAKKRMVVGECAGKVAR